MLRALRSPLAASQRSHLHHLPASPFSTLPSSPPAPKPAAQQQQQLQQQQQQQQRPQQRQWDGQAARTGRPPPAGLHGRSPQQGRPSSASPSWRRGSSMPKTSPEGGVSHAFMQLAGSSVQQLVAKLEGLTQAQLMEYVINCPYGRLEASDARAVDLVRTFVLALTMHLEGIVGHAPPHARLPLSDQECDQVLNLYKHHAHLTRPSLPLVSALLGGVSNQSSVRAQRALANAQMLGIQCPSLAMAMEEIELEKLQSNWVMRTSAVGPKSLRNLLGVCKTMRLPRLAEALATGFLHLGRAAASPAAAASSAPAATALYPAEEGKVAVKFWREWRSAERCPNPNLVAALIADLALVGAGTGCMREMLPAMAKEIFMGGGAHGEPPARKVAVAAHALLLRTIVGLALDEDEAGGEAAAAAAAAAGQAAGQAEGRSLEAFLTAARPLLLMATAGINEHYAATPPALFSALVTALASYNARSDVGGDAKRFYSGAVLQLGPGDHATVNRWLRNGVKPGAQTVETHKITIDLGVLVTAAGQLEALRKCPRAAALLEGIPPVHAGMVEAISGAICAARRAESEVHEQMLNPTAPVGGSAAAAPAALPGNSTTTSSGASPAPHSEFNASLSTMQQVVTLRVKSVLQQAAALPAPSAAAGSSSSSSSSGMVSGHSLAPQELAALQVLGPPSLNMRVIDYTLDMAWPEVQLGIEVDGPLHFESLTAHELNAALNSLCGLGADGDGHAQAMGAGDGTFFEGRGQELPAVADWTVPSTRYKLNRVGLYKRAAREPAAPTGRTNFPNRVRARALRLSGWSIVHFDYLELEAAQLPLLVKLLKGGMAFEDPAHGEAKHLAGLLELSAEGMEGRLAGGLVDKSAVADIVAGIRVLDLLILRRLSKAVLDKGRGEGQ